MSHPAIDINPPADRQRRRIMELRADVDPALEDVENSRPSCLFAKTAVEPSGSPNRSAMHTLSRSSTFVRVDNGMPVIVLICLSVRS